MDSTFGPLHAVDGQLPCGRGGPLLWPGGSPQDIPAASSRLTTAVMSFRLTRNNFYPVPS